MGAILSISSPNNIFEWMAFLAEKYSSMFLQGTWITLYVSVIGTIVGFILGYIVGIVGDIKIHKEDNPIKKGIIKFFKFICFLYVESVSYTHLDVYKRQALVFALLVLLIPYVMHYYLLENSVQKMYEQYDRMMNKIEPSFQVKPDDKK